MGRPTEYTPEIPSRVEKYLTACAEQNHLPTIEGLAVFLEVSRQTIYDWKDKQAEFLDILERLLAKQAEKLINSGLKGDFNSTITKLMLTKHGYAEKQEIDHTTGGKELLDPETRTLVNAVLAPYIAHAKKDAAADTGGGQ